MNARLVTRWNNGQKIQTMAESTPFGAERAKEILKNTLFGDTYSKMTDGEIAYTISIWDLMNGNTSFNDALRSIANDLVTDEYSKYATRPDVKILPDGILDIPIADEYRPSKPFESPELLPLSPEREFALDEAEAERYVRAVKRGDIEV